MWLAMMRCAGTAVHCGELEVASRAGAWTDTRAFMRAGAPVPLSRCPAVPPQAKCQFGPVAGAAGAESTAPVWFECRRILGQTPPVRRSAQMLVVLRRLK